MLSVVVRAVIKKLGIDLHEKLHSVIDHSMDCPSLCQHCLNYTQIFSLPVPVSFRVLIEWREHDWENNLDVVADEITEVFIVPEVKSSFCNLEVRTGDRLSELVKERLLNLGEFGGIHDFKYVLHFIQEHHLFCAVGLGPVPK